MKRTPLAREEKTTNSKLKREIQSLLRQIKLIEQGDCWVKLLGGGEFTNIDATDMGECNEVLQYDHLETRAKSISYANPKLGVLVCRRHHFYHGSPRREQRERYEELVRVFIGPERAKLWDKVRADNKPYHMGEHEWTKEILSLKQHLKEITK